MAENETQETLHFMDYWRVISSRKEIVIALCLLVVLTGVLVTLSMPKVFESSVLIQVEQEAPDVPVFSSEIIRYDPLFLRTQFEIIQSDPILEEVVRQLDLDRILGKAYGYYALLGSKSTDRTVKLLAKRLKVQQFRDTNLIEISVDLSHPEDRAANLAADAANMIAAVYRAQSMRRSREATERGLEAMYESLQEQEEKVAAAEEKVEGVRQKYALDLIGSTSESALPKVGMMQLEGERIRARMELAAKEAKWRQIENLSDEKLLDAAPYLVQDVQLSALVAQKRRSEVELSSLREAYGPKHPEVVQTRAVVSELTKKIQDALAGLKTGARAEYEAAKAKLEILEGELQSLKETERSAEAGGYREYEKASEELAHARRIRNALESRYLQERIELRIPRSMVEIIKPAKASEPDDYVSPNFLLNIILSVVMGLGTGIGLAFFIEYLDTSVKTIEDIERFMNVPVLGIIPQKVKAFVEKGANTAHLEAYRILRTNIQFSKKFKGGKTLCFTSGSVGEGKSLTLFNLAYVCAQLGDKVLIVDSDLHRPRQHKILKVSSAMGLSNVLMGEIAVEEGIIHTEVENLDFMPSGKMTSLAHGLLDTERMRELVGYLGEQYDLVLFDAPPIIGVSDALLLVREVDANVLVIQHRKYPRAVSSRAKDMVENVGANLIGVVLNNINISRDYSYYYYHHYYSYPYQQGSGRGARSARNTRSKT